MKEHSQAHQNVNYNDNHVQTEPVSWIHSDVIVILIQGVQSSVNIKAEISTASMNFERELCWNQKLDSKTYASD